MTQQFAVTAAVTLAIIVMMLFLCIDIIKKNKNIVHSPHDETISAGADDTINPDENNAVYPLYVDCVLIAKPNHSKVVPGPIGR